MGSSKHPASTLEVSLREKRIVFYTSSGCPKCDFLKRWLRSIHVDFMERNLDDVEVMASLIMRDIYVLSAPALEVRGMVYTGDQIFDGDGKVKSDFLDFLEEK